MAILKCKMCGGDIELAADKTFGTCEYCGSTMTLPKIDDDQRAAAFNRGNHFRRIGEFDKALAVYERIVRENENDAEAHWCCALCRFGIEYVEDPATFEYLPTCHRASFDSFLEDVDYLAALEHSEGITNRQYQKDAAKIAEVQRGILATSQNTEPYDVFICYKETDENGDRTRDSLLAQDIYYQLTDQGRKVFFSRITLEDVVGTQYEPYIFAALNSAKVMIVVGTKPEHLNAVWVKNEWSRFLAMMKKDRHKLLLPCYRDMDPYDMPEQLSVLQSYDMGKIGFIQDLTRGIAKVLDAEKKPEPVKETVVMGAANTAPLLKRAFMFLEDKEWDKADEFCEQVLNIDPECAEAYLGKLMAELKVDKRENLANCAETFEGASNYQKVIRFGNDELVAELKGYIAQVNTRNENIRLENLKKLKEKEEAARLEREHLAEISRKKAEEKTKRTKKIVAVVAPIVCAITAFVIVLNSVIIPKAENRKYDKLKNAEVGDYITLGTYEQDNNLSNGAEEIEWLVLDKKDSALLVISKYGLDAKPIYGSGKSSNLNLNISFRCTWETSTIRKWLNENFIDDSFSETEKSVISTVNVAADKNPSYDTSPGNDSQDNVFLLSIVEANKYFSSDEMRQCNASAYAISNGAVASHDNSNCYWWLRTPGEEEYHFAYVDSVGTIANDGNQTKLKSFAVRPAMWIDLSGNANGSSPKVVVPIESAEVGDLITLGTYEQDNDPSNGEEAIEWIVLKKLNDKMILISKFGLDKSFEQDQFIDRAFSEAESKVIQTVAIMDEKQAESYFASDDDRCCKPTPYAIAKGVEPDFEGNCWWRLSSMSYYRKSTYGVDASGAIVYEGTRTSVDKWAIRPAMWIDMSAI